MPKMNYLLSCCHSNTNTYGALWWYVDLLRIRDVKYIVMTNRESSSTRTRFLKWFVSKTIQKVEEIERYNNVTLCGEVGQTASASKEVVTFTCDEVVQGRYVTLIKSYGREHINICEVEVYGPNTFLNHALKKPTKMSSYLSNMERGYKINDGIAYGRWDWYAFATIEIFKPNVTHWWMVDLGKPMTLRYIVLTPATTYGNIAKLYKVQVSFDFDASDWSRNNFKLCVARTSAFLKSGTPDAHYANCKYGTKGRYVVLEKNHGSYLLLTELEVFASEMEDNLAIGRATVQVDEAAAGHSFLFASAKTSPKAVDGDNTEVFSGGSCIVTPGTSKKEWLAVELDALYKIRYIVMTNRADSGHCTGPLGVANDRKTIPDSSLSGEANRYRYLPAWGRMWFERDGWCGSSSYKWFQVNFGKNVLMTGVTIQAATYYYVRSYYVSIYFASGWQYIKTETGQTITFVGVGYRGSLYYKTAWFPKAVVGSYLRIYPRWVYYYACLKLEVHGCWDFDSKNYMDNFKIQVSKTFQPQKYASVPKSLCYEHKDGPIDYGYLQPIYCLTQPVGKYVIIEKDTSKAGKLSFCELEVYGTPDDGNLAYHQPAWQKSTYWDMTAELAVDGKTNPRPLSKKCSQTMPAAYDILWWGVDLGKSEDIGRVLIHGEENCCDKCLNTFDILVTDNFDRTNSGWSKNKFKVCHKNSIPFKSAEVKIFHCPVGLRGRFVVIKAPGIYPLTLCEVKIYPRLETGINLALGKLARQSSDNSTTTGLAKAAVDGDRTADFSKGSCSLTCSSLARTWWTVDLEKIYQVRKIMIFNRGDCCGTNFRYFSVMVSNAFVPNQMDAVHHVLCHYQTKALTNAEVKTVYCTKRTNGRHVTIQKDKSIDLALSICEVEVYGNDVRENLALKKPATQNKGLLDRYGIDAAGRATDGNASPMFSDHSCTQTVVENSKSWWSVDLRKSYKIDLVIITNRVDANQHYLRSYAVQVSTEFHGKEFDELAYHFCRDMHSAKELLQDIVEVRCLMPVVGRHVTIKKDGSKFEQLQLCEVEVFGMMPDSLANVALKKPTGQCSEDTKYSRTSERANDGNKNAKMSDGSCSETSGLQEAEWWTVDLEDDFDIKQLTISTRADSVGGKAVNLTFVVSSNFSANDLNRVFPGAFITTTTTDSTTTTTTTAATTTTTAAGATTTAGPTTTPLTTTTIAPIKFTICSNYVGSPAAGQKLDINCTARARHVTIVKTKVVSSTPDSMRLTLCEVEVFAESGNSTSGLTTTMHPGTGRTTAGGGVTGGVTGGSWTTTTIKATTQGQGPGPSVEPEVPPSGIKTGVYAATATLMTAGTAVTVGLMFWKYKSIFSSPQVSPAPQIAAPPDSTPVQ
ncbi:uncharacterized protein LOC135490796 [Lineus longissimus]|uniref:uncharacterized protein LOC135490796 n=1 Tax=Lineus longissimus TaxID=88925 RepID=UPI002B4D4A1B